MTKSLMLALATALVLPAAAQAKGEHPAYLHALTDLRHARAQIESRGASSGKMFKDEEVAIHEIDEAIREIKAASIDDGKNLNDHPPVDLKMDRAGKLHRAEELLHKTHDDVGREEDHAEVRGLRDRALRHIAEAWHATQRAIQASK
ncbi:MAG TPA: hypothetical protein VH083_09310 [Myxococcales bacterium]|nr:hypothetical protein [Myxococcales bacterium]